MQNYEVVEHGKPLQSVIRETPKPQGTEVLVRITHSGVCHSDLHIWDGYFDWGGGKKFYVKDRGCVPPFTMGHEPYGKVIAMGPQASGAQLGDSYIVYPWMGCGSCDVCHSDQDNYCLKPRFVGVVKPGAYSTHMLVPDAKYLVPAPGIDPGFAATLACSGLTVYSGITKFPPLGKNDWVVVLGCGGLGMIALSTLAAMGISNVIACDYGLTHNFDRLVQDHQHARMIGETLAQVPGVRLYLERLQTNIIVFELDGAKLTAPEVVTAAKEKGVLLNALGPSKLRLLTHLDVSEQDCRRATDVLVQLLT